MAHSRSTRLQGSGRAPVRGAQRVSPAPDNQLVHLSVIVRRAEPDRIGASQSDIDQVVSFLTEAGITVTAVDADRRTINAEGPVTVVQQAFDVALSTYEGAHVKYRGREGHVHLPDDLVDVVDAVFGLDNRAQAKTHLRTSPLLRPLERTQDRSGGQAEPHWPGQVARAYEFPQGTGAGQTIALLQFGGGYSDDELGAYFAKADVDAPSVVSVGVDRSVNEPTGSSADEEVLLDIEICGAVANGADIVVYFCDPTDRGFVDALTTAIHDRTHRPSVISISWGAAEGDWTLQARRVVADALVDAARLGITVFAASGDHGAGDGEDDGELHANFPASAAGLVACGGTALQLSDGRRHVEVVWNDDDGWASGGGFSATFDRPEYQVNLGTGSGATQPGRGIPDIAGCAAIETGFITRMNGVWKASGGTSAVAPLYAALTAILNEQLGRRIGPLNPVLYGIPDSQARRVFHDIRTGHNGTPASGGVPAIVGYEASEGWDPCTGMGVLRGQGLLQYLTSDTSGLGTSTPTEGDQP